MNLMDPIQMQRVATASELLFREAAFLDERRWNDWLGLYTADCVYWVPAWKSEDRPTEDPQSETSLIFYNSKSGLEDRVWRVTAGTSSASRLLPRTQHQITNVRVATPGDGLARLEVQYQWCVNQYEHKLHAAQVFFGHAEATLVEQDGNWHIARKKVLLLNDYIPTKLDFYSL